MAAGLDCLEVSSRVRVTNCNFCITIIGIIIVIATALRNGVVVGI